MRCIKDKRKHPLPDGGESEERPPETWEEVCDLLDEFEERDRQIRIFKERFNAHSVHAVGDGQKGGKKGRGRGAGRKGGGGRGGRKAACRFKACYGDCRYEHDWWPYDHHEAALQEWREAHPNEVRLRAQVNRSSQKGGKKGKSKGKGKENRGKARGRSKGYSAGRKQDSS